jgi:hypothetical protein
MLRLSLAALLILVLTSCKPPEDQLGSSSRLPDGIQVSIELGADRVIGVNPLTVNVLADGIGVSGASGTVTGDMTHAGMIPVIRTANEQEPGRYLAADFEFDMGGDWFVTADITLPDGTRASSSLPVAIATGR